jgi:GNAT superfamily N-acetyltransferase
MHHLWSNGDYEISTDPARVDVGMVHEFLTNSYWAKGIPVATVRLSIENSICFAVYHGQQQVGFARVISDLATFAYLADVFIVPPFRGRGLSRWLMECIVGHPDLQGLRRWMSPLGMPMAFTPSLDLPRWETRDLDGKARFRNLYKKARPNRSLRSKERFIRGVQLDFVVGIFPRPGKGYRSQARTVQVLDWLGWPFKSANETPYVPDLETQRVGKPGGPATRPKSE